MELERLNFNSPVIFINIHLKTTKLEKLTKGLSPKDLFEQMSMLTERDI